MVSSVTLEVPVESDQLFLVTCTTLRLVPKSYMLPSLLSETNKDLCLNCIWFFCMLFTLLKGENIVSFDSEAGYKYIV